MGFDFSVWIEMIADGLTADYPMLNEDIGFIFISPAHVREGTEYENLPGMEEKVIRSILQSGQVLTKASWLTIRL